MQPNKYQNIVLDDLRMFLAQWLARKDPALAYRAHWDEKGAVRMPQYRPAPHGAPQICTKVPTAGGKTLIGIYALREVLNAPLVQENPAVNQTTHQFQESGR